MTVTRKPATTLVGVECYRCGGPHFKRNKKTGWVCTAALAKSSTESAAVNSAAKLVAAGAVADGFHLPQPRAVRSYASAAGSSQDQKTLSEKLEAQSALLDQLVAKNKALEERLKLFHQVHFAHITCRCFDAEPENPKRVMVTATRRLPPQDPKPATVLTVVEGKKDETKLAKPVDSSKTADIAAEACSFTQFRKELLVSAAVDATDLKKESPTKPEAKRVTTPKTATPAAVEAFINLCPSGTLVSAAVGSTDTKTEDKFVLNLKRDREEDEEVSTSKSSRARKRQRQTANKKVKAADFFNLQGNASTSASV